MVPPKILSLESATEICSVCISEGESVLSHREEKGYIHSSLLAVFIKECLEEAKCRPEELHAVSVSIGPGSYTGLRVGLATAKGFCFIHDLPLISVSTLEAIAVQARRAHPQAGAIYLPMIDARRMEVYVSAYTREGKKKLEDQPLILNKKWFEQWADYEKIILCGNGSPKVRQLEGLAENIVYSVTEATAKTLIPLALAKYQDGEFEDIAYLEPEYIKSANVTKSKKKLL